MAANLDPADQARQHHERYPGVHEETLGVRDSTPKKPSSIAITAWPRW